MTTCKRYFRNCNEFGICVNIGKKGYVLAEEPTERKTIFQYGINGIEKIARIAVENYNCLASLARVGVKKNLTPSSAPALEIDSHG